MSSPEIHIIKECLPQGMLFDQRRHAHRLRQLLRQLPANGVPPPELSTQLTALTQAVESSALRVEERRRLLPAVTFPDVLPISAKRDEIAALLEKNQVIVLCGETGSGKSTQLPKLCLSLGRGVKGLIGHTQPRRIAARTLAARIAAELNTELGQAVGYKIRFTDRIGPNAYIKLMTDGILLAEIENDRLLEQYDTLIIDEAHERSLNIDLILGYLKTVLPERPDLKVIVTSATIDPERFSRHFGSAPILEVSGRTYPVELRYRPWQGEDTKANERDLDQAIVEAVEEVSRIDRGDILVFLPGEREIRETAEALRKKHPPATDILPLYSRLSAAEQNRVFQPHDRRHIVLATNVAETSLTVPGIRFVIDPGQARLNRYSPRTKVQRLMIEKISQASANQRAGRCGRVSAGVCLRLYDPEDFTARPLFTDPEILRTNLAAVILKLKSLRFGEIEEFPFIEPPDGRFISAGYKLLEELGALDSRRELTPIGRQLAKLPLDPRIARMLLAGSELKCLTEILIIASALSVQDPRERPVEAQQKADEAHRLFTDERSDFVWYLKLWQAYHEQARHLSKNKLRQWCTEHYLGYMRMREWLDIHAQITALVHDMGFKSNDTPADYAALHQALITGLLGNLGFKNEKNEYTGARGVKFAIFPGSSLFKAAPAWIMAAELAETSRLYARTVAKIESEWVERAAPHLIRRTYLDPHWEKRAGRVMAYERVTLYGLVLVPKRKVDYTRIDPVESRRLFIQAALVESDYDCRAGFFRYNRQVLEDVEDLQHRARRLDIVADETVRFAFYDERLPATVVDARSFEHWLKDAERKDPKALYMERSLLLHSEPGGHLDELYPATLRLQEAELPLSYCFDPGEEHDGVTVTIPMLALNQLNPLIFEWLVPGLLKEKMTALIQSLPKNLRRNFIPVDRYVEQCWQTMKPGNTSLTKSIASCLKSKTGIDIPMDAWQPDRLPSYLFIHLRIVDGHGKIIAEGDDLAALQAKFGSRARASFQSTSGWDIEREGLTQWDFGKLPETVESRQGGVTVRGYPALVDRLSSVSILVFDREQRAQQSHRLGLIRLFILALPQAVKYLEKNLPGFARMAMQYLPVGSADELRRDFVTAVVEHTFLNDGIAIRTEQAFKARLEQSKGAMTTVANQLSATVSESLQLAHDLRAALKKPVPASYHNSYRELQEQWQQLIYPGFISAIPAAWLSHLPRFLKAMQVRLNKLEREPAKDRQKAAKFQVLWENYKKQLEKAGNSEELIRYRWLLEEFRVSLFAQELGTSCPVSETRLAKQWEQLIGQ